MLKKLILALLVLSGSAHAYLTQQNPYLTGLTANLQAQVDQLASGGGRTLASVTADVVVPVLTKDYLLNANTDSGVIEVTLPDAITSNGFCASVKNTGTQLLVNSVQVTTTGGQMIDDSAPPYSLSGVYESAAFCAMGSNWYVHY